MIQKTGAYKVGSRIELTTKQIEQLADTFAKPPAIAKGVLAGRAAIARIDLHEIGPVVVKNYTRGGMIRAFNYNTYLKSSTFRCEDEFNILHTLFTEGVKVPEPIAFGIKGNLFYNGWLITKEVRASQTLVEKSQKAPNEIKPLIPKLLKQVELLVERRIHHVDLHPGNVLVDEDNEIYIIDFDKAKITDIAPEQLWTKYENRWQRSLEKHGLIPELKLNGTLG